MPISFVLSEEVLTYIVLGLIVPAMVIGVTTYFGTRQNHRCIQRLEKKMDLHEERAIEKETEMILELEQKDKDTRAFFVDWIQRVEDLLRTERVAGVATGAALNTTAAIETKLDKLASSVDKLVDKFKSE